MNTAPQSSTPTTASVQIVTSLKGQSLLMPVAQLDFLPTSFTSIQVFDGGQGCGSACSRKGCPGGCTRRGEHNKHRDQFGHEWS